MVRRLSIALLALLTSAQSARAQAELALPVAIATGYVMLGVGSIYHLRASIDEARVGTEVRFAARENGAVAQVRGRLTAIDADSITLLVDSNPRRIARSDIRKMSQHVGMEAKWAQGFVGGLVAGAAIGAGAGFASGDDPPGNWFALTAPQKGALLGIFGGVSGSLIGTALGALVQGDRWVSVKHFPAEPRLTIAPLPRRGMAVGAHLRF